MSAKDNAPSDQLPYEPGSLSELLAATHLFTVEVFGVNASPWSKGPDDLEHRTLNMSLGLLEQLKGSMGLPAGQGFSLIVGQKREDEYFMTDYHGLWSHEDPGPGVRYLVIAQAPQALPSISPADLMTEAFARRLMDAGYAEDVRLAGTGEQLIQEAAAAGTAENKDVASAGALLAFAAEHKSAGRDLFAGYIWARVWPGFSQDPDELLPVILPLVQAEDATLELRRYVADAVYRGVMLLDSRPDLAAAVAGAFLPLLLQPAAPSLQAELVDVEIYNLVFRSDDSARLPPEQVIPDSGTRKQLAAALARFTTERAAHLQAWLSGAAPARRG